MHGSRLWRRGAIRCRIYNSPILVIERGYAVCLGSNMAQLIKIPAKVMVANSSRIERQIMCSIFGPRGGPLYVGPLIFSLYVCLRGYRLFLTYRFLGNRRAFTPEHCA